MNNDVEVDYKSIYQQAWNQYNIYCQAYSVYNNKFNTVGAVSSIFILVIATAAEAWNRWFYLPVPLLLFPFFVALRNITKRIEIPWFNKEKLISQMRKGKDEFFNSQIDDIFLAADTLFKYKVFARKWLSISIWSVISSVIVSFMIALCFICSCYIK